MIGAVAPSLYPRVDQQDGGTSRADLHRTSWVEIPKSLMRLHEAKRTSKLNEQSRSLTPSVPLRSEDVSMATVEITERCHAEDLAAFQEEIQRSILIRLQMLELTPGFGKALVGNLAPYRSLTYGRVQILYRFHAQSDTVFVMMVELRKGAELDGALAEAKRLCRAGRFEDAVEQLRTAGERNLVNLARETGQARVKRASRTIPEKRGGA